MNEQITKLQEEIEHLKSTLSEILYQHDKILNEMSRKKGEETIKVPFIDFSGEEDLMLPKRNKVGDIGYDAYAHETVVIPAHSSAKVSLGIGAIIPEGFGIAARTRGGRWLEGLLVGPAHVDLNYRGCINALLYNVTDEDIIIEKGERPCSIDLYKTYAIEWQPLEEYLEENNLTEEQVMNTNRGDTGFGNSGK